jgi:hypothetical protein
MQDADEVVPDGVGRRSGCRLRTPACRYSCERLVMRSGRGQHPLLTGRVVENLVGSSKPIW